MRLTSPFTGYTVDLLSRRLLIPLGLAFWSLICAATAFSRNFVQLILLRGAEGLGESFYFPASMSMLADYHGPRDAFARDEHPSDERVSGNGRRAGFWRATWVSYTAGGRRSGFWAWRAWYTP